MDQSQEGLYIGLMSGTSLDGLDIVAVRFTAEADTRLGFEIVAGETRPYAQAWEQRLLGAYTCSGRELVATHWAYGQYLGQQVRAFVAQHALDNIVAVGSHGHTLFHQPDRGYTYQLGEGHALHEACGLPVVCDFRSANVAKGGQGAPLVPIGDALLFGDYAACLNLGGFANVSFANAEGHRQGYDIGPCNRLLNPLAARLGLPYDDGGGRARQGVVHEEWLHRLNALPFYAQTGAKSLGQEWVDEQLTEFLQADVSPVDLLATATRHIAQQLARALAPLANRGNGQVLVTGGGAFNQYLIERTQSLLPGNLHLYVPQAALVHYKEALIFALLAQRWVRGEPNTLARATGSPVNHTGGVGYGWENSHE